MFCPFFLNYDESGKCSGGVHHSAGTALLYPDVVGDDFGLEKSDNILPLEGMHSIIVNESLLLSALIPLKESMGTSVTPHLHEKVNHILCILKYHDAIDWGVFLSSDVFERPSLHEELRREFKMRAERYLWFLHDGKNKLGECSLSLNMHQ